jgi:hypothetical protein
MRGILKASIVSSEGLPRPLRGLEVGVMFAALPLALFGRGDGEDSRTEEEEDGSSGCGCSSGDAGGL